MDREKTGLSISTIVCATIMFICAIILVGIGVLPLYVGEYGNRIDSVDNYLTQEYFEELSDKKVVLINHDHNNSNIKVKTNDGIREIDFVPEVKLELPYGIVVIEDYQVKYHDKTKSCGYTFDPEYECIKENAEKFIELSLYSLKKNNKISQEIENIDSKKEE